MNNKKQAFTLAELLIVIGILGVVAVLSLPTLVTGVQTKQFATADAVFISKIKESLSTMNTEDVLRGYTTTEDFVKELQKHFKITKICTETPTECFAKTITWGEAGEADLTKITTSKDFAIEDYGTNVVGLMSANGMSLLLAYNPKCNPDPHSNQSDTMECVAILYDTNAETLPNTYTKDINKTDNVKEIAEKK